MKRKNVNAVALGRRRKRNEPAPKRQQAARRAAEARWAKRNPKPTPEKFWVLFAIEDPDHPEVLLSSPDKNEVKAAQHKPEFRDRWLHIDYLEYDPRRLTIQREYKPDVERQLNALRVVLDVPVEGGIG